VRVAVLTTSYPRPGFEHSGRFVADAVERLRAAGVDVPVLGPGSYRHFGLTEGGGVMHEARRRPWAPPLLVASMARAAVRERGRADLVHAHWLQTAAAAWLARMPYVVTLHGTDLAVAVDHPRLARRLLRGARAVIAVSNALADEARRLGAHEVTVIPNGIEIPPEPGVETEPPYVLFAGRLSEEKGVEEFVAATRGLRTTVAGDGPLRDRVPGALGFVPREEFERLLAGAAVVAVPSRREGFGVACAEAMAYGRPVVASAVGGLLDLVRDGETGLLVPPRDPAALRAALNRLLTDRELRERLGAAARAHVTGLCAWDRITERTIAVYRSALSGRARPTSA
jgi:glycosyltransferase involved in cell wall biosynthesis